MYAALALENISLAGRDLIGYFKSMEVSGVGRWFPRYSDIFLGIPAEGDLV